MANWFRRERKRADAPRVRSRSASAETSTRVDLDELTPPLMTYLAKAAYLQLMLFENLGRVVATAPTIEAKSALSRAAAAAIAKHHGLTVEIERQGSDPATVMEPEAAAIDRFQRVTQGSDWYESVTSCYLTAGFLNDFFVQLAGGLPSAASARVTAILSEDSGEGLIVAELLSAIEANSRLGARLALWGRRLVGETMLIARSALVASANRDSAEKRLEPVFTELIAAHTRRMDALGLTA